MNQQRQQQQQQQYQEQTKQLQERLRRELARNGTNVSQNDADPYGDGDQSELRGAISHASQQYHRELFAHGGDIAECSQAGMISQFGLLCILGNVSRVRQLLEAAAAAGPSDNGLAPPELVQLLERRETSLRLSPLLLIVSAGKNISLGNNSGSSLQEGQIQVAELLLSYGARPDARDVCGKTVCHYGAGAMATDMTLAVVERCAAAYQTSHWFGRTVELSGLKNAAMNGKRGIARGYHWSSQRREVYLLDEQKQIAVKPENIKLVVAGTAEAENETNGSPHSNNDDITKERNLCNLQCRLGVVSLQETLQGQRPDVATFLIHKLHAAVDIADWDGCSPQSMATTSGAEMMSPAASIIKDAVTSRARAAAKAERRKCAQCGKPEPPDSSFDMCSRCKQVRYCGRDCQVSHWRSTHKKECQELATQAQAGVKLQRPPSTGRFVATFNAKTRQASATARDTDGFGKPNHVAVGEKFFVKIQGGGPTMPLMIYDETRQCSFDYPPGLQGFDQLRSKVNAEPAFQGRKTYMKASFDQKGNCTMYPGTATLKKW